MSTSLTPYQRIMRAAQAGRGVRLSAEDCWAMSRDDAISALAENDDAGECLRDAPAPFTDEEYGGAP